MTIRELLEQRATLVNESRGILETAEGENRELSQEEQNRWDEIWSEVERLGDRVERMQRQETMERELELPLETATRPTPGGNGNGDRALPYAFQARSLQALNEHPERLDQPEWRRLLTTYASDEYRRAYMTYLQLGAAGLPADMVRALQVDQDDIGGYLVTPIQMVDRLIMAMDNIVYMRQWATVFAVPNAESLGAVSLDADPADPTWTSELDIGSEDTSMALGKRELNPHPLAKYIKVSRKLLRKAPSAEQLVMDRLGYKFSVTAENAYQNGSGANEPLGVFVASDLGISTSRDESTDNTATEIKADNLRNCKYKLKQQYRSRARWLFHRDAIKMISKLKDDNNQYLWQPGLTKGDPDSILNMPAAESEYSPNTFTTGLYVGLLGDFSYYWIADSLALEMQRLVELYAATNQIGIIGRLESDGMPVLEEAFVRVKLG